MAWYIKVHARHCKLAPRTGGRSRKFKVGRPRGKVLAVPIMRTRIA